MPKLLRSSETAGCGATIELDNGEVVYVSIAQTGVLVRKWDMNGGLIKSLLSNFFGAKLYNESNVYKNAQTARALSLMYPEQAPPLCFKNPVLAAFSNAMWQCASAAEVCAILNEAMAKAPDLEEEAVRTVPRRTFGESDDKIVSDLADLMAKGDTKPDAFYDVSVLPHPKEDILLAIERKILSETSDARVEWLTVGATFLPSFQEGIGPKPLSWFGVDLAELQRSTVDPREQAKVLAQNPDRKRAEQFLAVMKIESDQIQARIDAVLRLRQARMKHSTLATADRDADVHFKMGNKYISGRELPQDYAEAAKWYRKAAEQGHAMAQSQLGLMFASGQGVPQDFAEAARWCRPAAEAGVAEAQWQLGDMHIKGQGVPQDYTKAAEWCRKAAEQGNPNAQMLLGALYHNGQGVPRDYVQAQMWLTLAAAGFPPSKAGNREKVASLREIVAAKMTEPQIAQAQEMAREWKPGNGRALPPRVDIALRSRPAQTAPLTQDTVPPSPPLTPPSPSGAPDRSRAPTPAPREQLTFDKVGKAIIGPDDMLPVIAGYSNSALRILDVSEDEAIRRTECGDGGRFALGSLVRTLKDAKTYPEASYYAKFHTDEDGEIDSIHHGWCFDSFALVNGHEVILLQGLRFADTIDGVLSAFFASAILPTIGAYWHGLYDRDYQVVETPKELNELIFGGTLKEATGDTQGILRTPLGLRIQKVDGGKRCTCLCHSETDGLLDIEVTVLADGRACEAVRTVLREPEGRTLY
jgi:TPR repeat protein